MISFNKLNSSLSFYGNLNRSLAYITICSILLFNLMNLQLEKDLSISNRDKDVFISFSIQNAAEYSINERELRQGNTENINYSINSIHNLITSQNKISCLYEIDDNSKIFGSILTLSPNNHSFRAPPSNR